MRIGLALPQYDYSIAGESPLRWDTVVEYARAAERRGTTRSGCRTTSSSTSPSTAGPPIAPATFDPIVTLAALAGTVTRPRLGTLVLCEALRPASVLAKALATLDRICGGRLDVGIGAGWYEPEYEAIGMALPSPGERLARLREAVEVLRGLLGGGPFTFDGRYHRAFDARNEPRAAQQRPTPPIIVGGKGDRLLALVAELADGWNTCWAWTPEALPRAPRRARPRVRRSRPRPGDGDPLARALRALRRGRRDLERRFERLRA